jgi:hypothetical protein
MPPVKGRRRREKSHHHIQTRIDKTCRVLLKHNRAKMKAVLKTRKSKTRSLLIEQLMAEETELNKICRIHEEFKENEEEEEEEEEAKLPELPLNASFDDLFENYMGELKTFKPLPAASLREPFRPCPQ